MDDGTGWYRALRGSDSAAQTAALSDMADFVRRSLARGFGRQLEESDLDDLSQDVVLRVYEKIDSFRGDSRFSTWVASVAVNTALGELRRRRHRHIDLAAAVRAGEQALYAPPTPDRVQLAQRDRALRTAIEEALTDRQREALLAEFGGLPMVELAERLGSNRGAVYKLLHDARRRLRKHLEERGFSRDDLLPQSVEMSP